MVLHQDASQTRDGAAPLEQPEVKEAVDGVLDPNLSTATVVVPIYTGKEVGDEIEMFWKGRTPVDSTDDSIRVTVANKGRPTNFYVEAQYIQPNEGTKVEVSYTVTHANGSTDGSLPLYLSIGQQTPVLGEVQPPVVDGVAKNGVLNLESVPQQGARAMVSPYLGMQLFDVVFIEINDRDYEWGAKSIDTPAQVGQPVEFTIPRDILAGYAGQTIELRSTVIPAKGGKSVSPSLPVLVLEPVGALPKAVVPLATGDGNALDPKTVTGPTIEVVVKPYPGVAERDVIAFTWKNSNDLPPQPFQQSQTAPQNPQKDYSFPVPRAYVDQNIDGSADLFYTVTRGTVTKPSDGLTLWIGNAFQAPAKLDLTGRGYIVAEKTPPTVSDAYCYQRSANFGQAPYTYVSSDPAVVTVDKNTGKVAPVDNGTAIITATDSQKVSRAYPITVSGVRKVYFVSGSANFKGAQAACAAAGLATLTLDEMRQFWRLYYPSAGPVADYLSWLSYPFWTSTNIGAGTAYAYDLNGDSAQGNATGRNQDDYLQVTGIAP
ncbi:hypothetical protein PHO31112_03916 [Pandoraea horticolens]|uniref:BIG2 domain-containing protein n=1 Tax=Pandoraea horticolens TaxID=2508298 RepID=A0A5E4XJI5_9BURK|nr:Ig-like domain-containing protein [Pandoraea horticolens]VVE36619.1 hypothetical protein PHO31112_03916 [Pandoraea horticolens]